MAGALVLALALSGCPLYQPDLLDCALPCADGGVCPSGMSCVEGLCRPPAKSQACECLVGRSRPCGTNVGACKQGFQECTTAGTWGACQGGIGPSPEVCDGKDNDCDGLTDYLPAKQLVVDRNPYTTYSTRLFGFDAGFLLYHYSVQADGGDLFLVSRFDPTLAERGDAVPVRTEYATRTFVAATGDGVAMAFAAGSDLPVEVRTVSTAVGTPSVRLAQISDTSYAMRVRLAVTPAGPRVGWGKNDGGVRLVDVPWDGGTPSAFDLPLVNRGARLDDFTLSADGRYSLWKEVLDDGDGGTRAVDLVADNRTRRVVRSAVSAVTPDSPFTRGRQPLISRGDQLAYETDWTDASGATHVSLTYDLLTADDAEDIVPVGAWDVSDWTVTPSGGVLGVVSNLREQSLVLFGVTGTSYLDYENTIRYLPTNSGFGPPTLALTGGEMVGVAWTTSKGIMGRLVCPPRVGD